MTLFGVTKVHLQLFSAERKKKSRAVKMLQPWSNVPSLTCSLYVLCKAQWVVLCMKGATQRKLSLFQASRQSTMLWCHIFTWYSEAKEEKEEEEERRIMYLAGEVNCKFHWRVSLCKIMYHPVTMVVRMKSPPLSGWRAGCLCLSLPNETQIIKTTILKTSYNKVSPILFR